MNPTGGHTAGLSPSATQTAIDGVAWPRYMRDEQPMYLSAKDEFFFKQEQANEMVHVWEEDSDVGAFRETGEQETITSDDTFLGNQKTAKQRKWMKQIPVSFEAFKTDQVGVGKRTKIGTQIGDRARLTQDQTTIQDTYGDAFTGAISTTPDGQNWASNSHVLLKTGATLDNLETGAFNADNLWVVVQSLANQKAQDGEAGSQVFEGLAVPFILSKTAKEVMDSDLVPNSAENNLNYFDTIYGTVRIVASIFLGSTYNANANANTSYHVISSSHHATRRALADLSMNLIAPENTANDTYIERARYMEAHYIETWEGYVGSNGIA